MLGYKLPSRPHTAPTHFHRGRRMVASGDTSPRTTSNGACRAQRCPAAVFPSDPPPRACRRDEPAQRVPSQQRPGPEAEHQNQHQQKGRAQAGHAATHTTCPAGAPTSSSRTRTLAAAALPARLPAAARPRKPAQACASCDSPCLCRTASPPARSSSKALSCRQTRRPRRTAAAAPPGRGSAGGGGTRGCLGSGRVRRTESARAHHTRLTKRRC